MRGRNGPIGLHSARRSRLGQETSTSAGPLSSIQNHSTAGGLCASQRPGCRHSSATKTGEDLLAFLQETVLPRFGTGHKIYVVWDNFSAHKRALNLWTTAPTSIKFFWTPTNASWLNLIEPWFLVLEKTALYNTDLKTTEAIADNLKQGINYLNDHPRPYRWAKTI